MRSVAAMSPKVVFPPWFRREKTSRMIRTNEVACRATVEMKKTTLLTSFKRFRSHVQDHPSSNKRPVKTLALPLAGTRQQTRGRREKVRCTSHTPSKRGGGALGKSPHFLGSLLGKLATCCSWKPSIYSVSAQEHGNTRHRHINRGANSQEDVV